MQTANPTVMRYDPLTILFHWLIALLIGVQWIVALSIDLFRRARCVSRYARCISSAG
jgi:cytochrome b561